MLEIQENSEAKLSAFNDMQEESRKSSDKHRKMKSNLQDALNTADIHRLVIGEDFVDDDNTIKTIIKERY
tara:strand:- start:926 stop:1135 length:210 start_codon:yes stop_codon:yes gene_type:complete